MEQQDEWGVGRWMALNAVPITTTPASRPQCKRPVVGLLARVRRMDRQSEREMDRQVLRVRSQCWPSAGAGSVRLGWLLLWRAIAVIVQSAGMRPVHPPP